MGQSVCGLAGNNFTVITVESVRGTLSMTAAGTLSLETMQQGLSAALGDADKVVAFWQSSSGGRRLQSSKEYNVRYEARVPPGMTSSELLGKVNEMNDENSTTLDTFTSKLSDAGVSVQDLTFSEPEAVSQKVFADATGQEIAVPIAAHSMPNIIPAADSPGPTPAPSGGGDSGDGDGDGDGGGGDDAGAAMMPVIIGGGAGGGCCCILCLGATIFIIRRRRKLQEA